MAAPPPPAGPGPLDGASIDGRAPLRGRNIGILCDDPDHADALVLQQAVAELGARVALVNSTQHGETAAPSPVDTARVLGRLYDAVICVDLPADRVQALLAHADIPVLTDIAAQWRAHRALNAQPGASARPLLQALLTSLRL